MTPVNKFEFNDVRNTYHNGIAQDHVQPIAIICNIHSAISESPSSTERVINQCAVMSFRFPKKRGPLIIPNTEARSEFPKIQCLMSILTILGPLVSGWVICDNLFGGFWCPDGWIWH